MVGSIRCEGDHPAPVTTKRGGHVLVGLGKSVGVGRGGAVEGAAIGATADGLSVGAGDSPTQPVSSSTTPTTRISPKLRSMVPSFGRPPPTPCGQSLVHRTPGMA